ncbi:hypothetical protein WA158_004448 [Blastocystis sp. Blastoise]
MDIIMLLIINYNFNIIKSDSSIMKILTTIKWFPNNFNKLYIPSELYNLMDISMKTLLSELYHAFRYINNPFINIYSTPPSSISQSKSTITTLFYDLNENIYMNKCWLASSNYSIITKKTKLISGIYKIGSIPLSKVNKYIIITKQ